MTKEFQKAIYTRSRLKNKMNKNSTIINITYNEKNITKSIKYNNTFSKKKNVKSLFSTTLQKRALLQIKTFGLPPNHS